MRLLFVGVALLCRLLSCGANAQEKRDTVSDRAVLLQQLRAEKNENSRMLKPPSAQRQPGGGVVRMDVGSAAADSMPSDSVKLTDSLMSVTDSVEALSRMRELQLMQDSLRKDSVMRADYGNVRVFNPDPNRAMWLSLLCPGLGQVYNRRYWKLPIVVGGFVGLGYATAWNNRMLQDYTKAYRDAMDSDPSTKSYMDFYPPTYKEEDIDMEWLKKTLKSKKDYYRRNKEMCIIGMVGMYLLCVVDAYVDASLMHFDISDDLSMNVKPAVIDPRYTGKQLPSVGVQCAFNF